MPQEKTNPTATTLARRILPQDTLSIVDMLMLCLRHWPWFILSLFLCFSVAAFYLLSTPKTYTRTTTIMLKNSGEKSNDIKLIEQLGVNNLSSNISDEIVAIHAPAAIYTMVRRLHLDVSYYRPGYFRDEPLYAYTLPVEATFHDLDDNAKASFTIALQGDGRAVVSELSLRGEPIEKKYVMRVGKPSRLGDLGTVTLTPTIYYKKESREEILVQRIGFWTASQRYGAAITAALQPGTNNIIDIRCTDQCIPRAENILKTIVNIYNENWVQNRNQISVSTNEFIKERLGVIEGELSDVEGDIASYKSSHGILSVEQAASQALNKGDAADIQRQTISNQLYMIRYVRSYVADPSNAKQLIPAGTGIGNADVEAQIAEYNSRILERNNLVANSSEQNPLVGDIDVALGNLRSAILKSLDNAQLTLNTQLATVQAAHSAALSKLSAAPQQQNHLLSYERQQKVKESLYLFLLQKREENELSQAFTAYNTRIIAEPWGSSLPTAPNRNNILLMALAIALAVPAAFFILREMSNSRVRGRKDLENMTVPYVGELPLWKPKKGEETSEHGYKIVVRQHKRDLTNEAFRVVRTNLEFMANTERKSRIVMLTSFNPGSGKTFICANLGASFGIRGTRVICIDLDLRRGSLSEFAGKPKQGLTNYLGGQVDDYRQLIVHLPLNEPSESSDHSEHSEYSDHSDHSDHSKHSSTPTAPLTLDFLPMGKVPPNPTELLYSPKLKPMLDELREQYDYIFVDCPPVEIVADATIISREADVTLFVVRAGLLERSMLPELEKNYEEKKYNNMAMILNGTDAEHHYGYHRYGYGYGRYGYGRYGYGKRYGYGYYGNSKKS